MSTKEKPTRYVCVHGHFYQPPRENPWLESIEPQPSAAPFRDWNVRILNECYRPNTAARIVDGAGHITRIANNYASISFDIGPTLMSWLQTNARDVYSAILHADRVSIDRFSGHGSAIAQAYNHMILPLANERDLRTQVVWGLRDFEYRFKRRTEGMWLPETAVDIPTLEMLAEYGVAYTVLAPSQCRRVRKLGTEETPWRDIHDAKVDTRRVYRVNLPSGNHIDVFFYDGPTSRAVAFEELLTDGGRFASRLLAIHGGESSGLASIATDGETFGHHHRYGDMALAFACRAIDTGGTARLTNYGEYRELFPAEWEAQIIEKTAWSCAHGVGRWTEDCGCNSGGQPEWRQTWRRPLRDALDWLRDRLAEVYETHASEMLRDPWRARDGYIEVILDRQSDRLDRFLAEHATRDLNADEVRIVLQLLEVQRNAMLMYTSCGWFFDDISGTEAVQVLRYAARAIELASRVTGESLEQPFVERLEKAPSNRVDLGHGGRVWSECVVPSRIDLRDVVAHHAVMSLFEGNGVKHPLYCYDVDAHDIKRTHAGKAKLLIGTARVTSRITHAKSAFTFAAMHLGDHNIAGGVRTLASDDEHAAIVEEVGTPFSRADLVTTQRALERHFHDHNFSLRSLFQDQRDYILSLVLDTPVAEAEAAFYRLYEHHAPLLRFLATQGMPQPSVLRTAAQFVVNLRLRRLLEDASPDLDQIRNGFETAKLEGLELDESGLGYAWQQALERTTDRLGDRPDDLHELERATGIAALASWVPFEVNLWTVQNKCWELSLTTLPSRRKLAAAGNAEARRWVGSFVDLCRAVRIFAEDL